MSRMKPKAWKVMFGAAAIGVAGAAGLWSFTECDVCEAATTVLLNKTVAQNCSIDVITDAGATTLPLDVTGAQHVQVGHIIQNCNKKAGYTLAIGSANCSAIGPDGAKVRDAVSDEYLRYSVEFQNPAANTVTGLLDTACGGQIGRNVTNEKVRDQNSLIFVNFAGDPEIGAGTYQDTLTVTMNVK